MTAVAEQLSPQINSFAEILDSLCNYVGEEVSEVNKILLARMDNKIRLIPKLAGHLINAGGKRIRPMLTVATAKLCEYEGMRHIPLAACIEFIHTATLLHDDVVDESNMRRGLVAASTLWGNKASVLVGDFLFSRAFELMVDDESIAVMRILSKAASTIIEGEILQLVTSNDTATTEEDYLEVVHAKTAELFAASCHISGILANKNKEYCQALRTYGTNLGIAFQLTDDILDYTANQVTFGKTVGDDFREGKITLPVVLAFNQSTDSERDFWKRTMNELDQKEGDLAHAIELFNRYNIFDQIIEKARHYAETASKAIKVFPHSHVQQILIGLADNCIYRIS